MTASLFDPLRLLWVDAQPSELDQAKRFLEAQRLAVRLLNNYEAALLEVQTWSPHLLLLDYIVPDDAMRYETFVHAHLPPADPYRPDGPLADNPWQRSESPILLVAGGSLVSTPGLKKPHMDRAAHIVDKPFDPSYLASLVNDLLSKPNPEIILVPDQGYVELEGHRHEVSERRMDLLVTLARHHPRSLTGPQLAQQLREELGVFIDDGGVRTAIYEIRQQLPVADSRTVVTRTNRGYVLTFTPTLVSD